MFSKVDVKDIFSLSWLCPWLKMKDLEISEFFSLAENEQEKSILLEMMKSFIFLDNEAFQQKLSSIAEKVCERVGVNIDTFQIVGTSFGHDPDSSHALLQFLKPKLSARGCGAVQMQSQLGKAISISALKPNIIMVDDFSGTGKTVISRVLSLKKSIAAQTKMQQDAVSVAVYLVASTKSALANMRASGVDVHAELILDKVISDHPDKWDIHQQKVVMRRIEAKLDQTRMTPFPSLGYDEAEAAYACEGWNIPNSVLPIFWWRHLVDGTRFPPLFDRSEPKYND